MKIYAVYKGEKFLCEGTAKECANYLDVKEATIRFWNTRTYKKRIKNEENKRTLAIVTEEG